MKNEVGVLFFVNFVGWFLPDLFVEFSIFCTVASCLDCNFLRELLDTGGIRPKETTN